MTVFEFILTLIGIVIGFAVLLGGIVFWVGFFASWKYRNPYKKQLAVNDALAKMKAKKERNAE